MVAAAVLLQACATSSAPLQQVVRVETPGCERATCELSNDVGRWLLNVAPGTVTLTASASPLSVSCRADAGPAQVRGVPSSKPEPTGSGAVVGGAVGGGAMVAAAGSALTLIPALGIMAVLGSVVVGASVGHVAEAGQQGIRYPDRISVPMSCPVRAEAAAWPSDVPRGPLLGLSVRGLTAAQAQALGAGARPAVLVTGVAADGAAAAAGLKAGDLVVAMNGAALRDAADLQERLQAQAPEAPLTLQLWRDGQWLERVLTRRAAP